jgi:hypothetical protein
MVPGGCRQVVPFLSNLLDYTIDEILIKVQLSFFSLVEIGSPTS